MSFDDAHFKPTHYVRHKYPPRRRGRAQICERCGVRRRYRMSDWEYRYQGRWTTSNPPCAMRAR